VQGTVVREKQLKLWSALVIMFVSRRAIYVTHVEVQMRQPFDLGHL
jgi:hypothetical protein